MKIRLEIATSAGPKTVSVKGVPCSIGSGPEDGVRLNHPSIKPGHAKLALSPAGTLVLAPGSGSIVIASGELTGPIALRNGMRARIGSVGFAIRLGDVPTRSTAGGMAQAVPPEATSAASGNPTHRTPLGLKLAYAGIVILLAAAAALPIRLLYGKWVERQQQQQQQQQVADAPGDPKRGPGDFQGTSARKTLTFDEVLQYLAARTAIYTELDEAMTAWQETGETLQCEMAQLRSQMQQLILARFARRVAGESFDEESRAVDDFERNALQSLRDRGWSHSLLNEFQSAEWMAMSMAGADPGRLSVDGPNLSSDPRWREELSKGNTEDVLLMASLGGPEALKRMTASAEASRKLAEDSCAQAEGRRMRMNAAAEEFAKAELSMIVDPDPMTPDLRELTYIQREKLANAGQLARETRERCLMWATWSPPTAKFHDREAWPRLAACFKRVTQCSTRAWWFKVPALRAALDAEVFYAGGDCKAWATAFKSSVDRLADANLEMVARAFWDGENVEEDKERARVIRRAQEMDDDDIDEITLDSVKADMPRWLEETILGGILADSRKDKEWLARARREAPNELREIAAYVD